MSHILFFFKNYGEFPFSATFWGEVGVRSFYHSTRSFYINRITSLNLLVWCLEKVPNMFSLNGGAKCKTVNYHGRILFLPRRNTPETAGQMRLRVRASSFHLAKPLIRNDLSGTLEANADLAFLARRMSCSSDVGLCLEEETSQRLCHESSLCLKGSTLNSWNDFANEIESFDMASAVMILSNWRLRGVWAPKIQWIVTQPWIWSKYLLP